MICCLDVDYRSTQGHCSAVLFKDWADTTPVKVYSSVTDPIAAYEPGAFYKRELPCMMNTLHLAEEKITILIIDGYVWLGENRGGLGQRLYETLNREIPVIGVAKSKFRGVESVTQPVLRGQSNNPLWVTAIGLDLGTAARYIAQMSGEYRLPDLIKLADGECRKW